MQFNFLFAAALNENFSETKASAITLHEDDPKTVKSFVQCLSVGEDIMYRDSDQFIKAWGFGDKIRCPGFQDFATTGLIESASMGHNTLRLAYQNSATGSKLRRYAIEQLRFLAYDAALADQKKLYVSVASAVEDIALDFLRSSLSVGDRDLGDPDDNRHIYMFEKYN